jgi:hypothetical protein
MSAQFHNRVALLLLISLCPAFSLSGGSSQAPTDPKQRTAEEDNIREAALRFQMVNWYHSADEQDRKDEEETGVSSQNDLNYRTFLISVDRHDPSNELLWRFKDIPRKIKPASKGKFVKELFPGWLCDVHTNERVISFGVGPIHWVSANQVEVEGGYYCGGLCAAGLTFQLSRVDGKWVVKRQSMKWIS